MLITTHEDVIKNIFAPPKRDGAVDNEGIKTRKGV
jgi:hypothetical protein